MDDTDVDVVTESHLHLTKPCTCVSRTTQTDEENGAYIATHRFVKLVAEATHAAEHEMTPDTPTRGQDFLARFWRRLNDSLTRHSVARQV